MRGVKGEPKPGNLSRPYGVCCGVDVLPNIVFLTVGTGLVDIGLGFYMQLISGSVRQYDLVAWRMYGISDRLRFQRPDRGDYGIDTVCVCICMDDVG